METTTENKMTIHRGLAELKLIDSKIAKKMENLRVLTLQQGEKPIEGRYSLEQWKDVVQGAFDSVNDLIIRKDKIKSAIVRVNAVTMIDINGKKISIADAITKKKTIELKKALHGKINAEKQATMVALNRNNETVEQNVNRLLEAAFGKDNTKISGEEVEAIRGPYVKANGVKMIDTLDVDAILEDLEKEIDTFEMEIDFKLSEINSITYIEI